MKHSLQHSGNCLLPAAYAPFTTISSFPSNPAPVKDCINSSFVLEVINNNFVLPKAALNALYRLNRFFSGASLYR